MPGIHRLADDALVFGSQAEALEGVAGRDEVADQHDRHRQAEDDAQGLQRRHPQRAPIVDREQRQPDMHRHRAVQQQRARRAVPDPHRRPQRALGGLERHQPEGMARQVQRDVGEQHQPRGQAQVAAASHGRAFTAGCGMQVVGSEAADILPGGRILMIS